jgi:AraC-like DNA-binding protein
LVFIAKNCAQLFAYIRKLRYNVSMGVFYESKRDLEHRNIEIFTTAGIAPHFHAQVEVLCVMRDFVNVTLNGETETVRAGGICVSGSYDVHSYSVNGGEGIVVLFPLDCLRRFFAYTENAVIKHHIVYDEKLFSSISALLELYKSNSESANPLFCEGWTNAFLGLLHDFLGFSQVGTGGRIDTFHEVLTYIRAHSDEELTLAGLSKRFGYSPYHFSRLFNSFINVGLKKYINSVRLENALDKMKNGESVTAAAFSSGFGSMRSFYRDFTEYYGETPQRYARVHFVGNKSRDK